MMETMRTPTRDNPIRMVQSLCNLHEETGKLLDECGHEPAQGSRAAAELRALPHPELVEAAYAQGNLLIEASADHLMAFARIVIEPVQTIAPWTCVRAVIESSALGSWLLAPNLDVRTRVQRSLAFRYEGLCQEKKFGQASDDSTGTAKVAAWIDDLEDKALGFGFSKVTDKRGKRIGIAQAMPAITEIVTSALDEEATYRLLSAVAHAHPWAVQQVGFRIIPGGCYPLIEKSMGTFSLGFLCIKTAYAFARPVWYKFQLFDWDIERIRAILDAAFNSLGDQQAEHRFWKR